MKKQINRVKLFLLVMVAMVILSACSSFDLFGNKEKEQTKEQTKEQSKGETQTEEKPDQTEEKGKKKKKKEKKKEKGKDGKEKADNQKNKGEGLSKVKVWGNKAPNKDSQTGDAKKDRDRQRQSNAVPLLTVEAARERILTDYRQYEKGMAASGISLIIPAPDTNLPESEQYLYAVTDDRYYPAMEEEGFNRGVNIIRERHPGPYMTFLLFADVEANQAFINGQEVPAVCFYVNMHSGMTFMASGPHGIYRMPDDFVEYYVPYAFEGYSDLDFLLSGLKEAGVIKNKSDYTWKYDLENWDFNNPPYVEGDTEEDIIRILLFEKATEKYFGSFDIDIRTQTIYESKSSKILYQNEAANYSPEKITRKNAAEKVEQRLRQLGYMDMDSQKLSFEAGEELFFEEIHENGFAVGMKVGDEESISRLFMINLDGSKMGSFNHLTQQYDIIYGNHMY